MPNTQDEIRAGVAELLEEVVGVSQSDINDDKTLRWDLEVDPKPMAELLAAVKEVFGVAISDEEMVRVRTVGDLVRQVEIAQHEIKA